MSHKQPDLDSLFLTALDIESPEKRAAFLTQACGGDMSLRHELEQLLRSHQQADGLLDQPAPELAAAIQPDRAGQDRAVALEAGLAAAFPANAAVVMGNANHSVMKALGMTIDVPRVVLRDAAESREPIVRPKSTEMPDRNSDSRYQLQGEIARGGMGAILKGRDTDLGRELAIKVLLEDHKDKPEVIQRFIEEAQIGGQLQHPGIIPVYELGQFADKRPYFSMKLVKGKTFAKLLADRADPGAERGRFIGIFEQVCQTMAYAHSRGVIHRDLKPANVMVGAFGEVQVMDWGLAKVLAAGGVADEKEALEKQAGQSIIHTLRNTGSDTPGAFGSHTQIGSVMGTPAYMPPEQALGEIDQMDERADVFGLGAILCEILTGKPPYVGDDATQVFRMASRGKLEDCLQRLDACEADEDLVQLAKHCLKLEPVDRPRDAAVLAERITGYLESVELKLRETELERAAEAARVVELHRRRKLHYAIAAMLLVGFVAAGFAAFHFHTLGVAQRALAERNEQLAKERQNEAIAAVEAREAESKQRVLAEQAKTRAELEKERADITLADMQASRGLQATKDGEEATAALWFANAALTSPNDPARTAANWLGARNWLNEAIIPVAILKLPNGNLRRMSFQPAGTLALTLNQMNLRVWDWRYEQPLAWSDARNTVIDAGWSPAGDRLALATSAGEVQIVEATTGEVRQRFPAADQVTVVQWSPDGTRLAVGGKRVQVWNVTDRPARLSDWPHPESVYGLTFNRSGTRLATACLDNLARVFATDDAMRPAPLFPAVAHLHGVTRMPNVSAPVFCDGDRKVVTFLKSRQPAWWDVETGHSEPPVWKTDSAEVNYSLVTSPDGRWVAASGIRSCLLWNVEGESFELQHPNLVQHAAFHPDGQSLLTTCWDGTARLWPLSSAGRTPRTISQMTTHPDCIIAPDGANVAIASEKQVIIWQFPQQDMLVGRIAAWTDQFRQPRSSIDGRLVTLGARHESTGWYLPEANVLSVAQMSSGQLAGPTITLGGKLWDSSLCADNRSVAAVYVRGSTGALSVFDVASGLPRFDPVDLPSLPQSVAARPGHPQVAVLCQDGKLFVINSEDGSLALQLAHEAWRGSSQYARAEYSPDGALLVSTSPLDQVSVRDADTGGLRYPSWSPLLDGGRLHTIAFSPDSRLLATAVTGRNAAQIWDLATGQSAAPPLPHPGDFWGIFSVAFSPDGQQILSGHKDGLLRLWNWKSGELVVPPMQHPDEVYDAQFTPDGRYAVTAVRNATLYVWDLATGKLAAPPLRFSSTREKLQTLCISGWHVITSAPPNYLVVDLSVLLKEPEVDIQFLQRRAELATNLKLQLGEMATLQQSEWDNRWDAYVAARTSPQADAQVLARALDESADYSARQLIARRAARMNLLERLLVLRPDEPQLHLTLADRLASQGDDTGTSRHRKLAIATMEKSPGRWASNPSAVSVLAQLLVDDSMASSFSPLTPVEMKSLAGTKLTLRSDGSILASQEPQLNETYTITGRTAARRIAALRLDALTDPGIEGLGPGWGTANFHLTEIRAQLRRAGQAPVPLRFRTAAADHTRSPAEGGRPPHGPMAVIDGDQATLWDIWPQPAQAHWLHLSLTESIDLADDDQIIVHLDFRDSRWPKAKLGCFRLSVAVDEPSITKLQLADAVRKAGLSGTDALAAAYLATGNAARAAELLQPTAKTGDSQVKLVLRATAQRSLGDLAAARGTAEQLVESLRTQSPPRALQELCFDIVSESFDEVLPAIAQRRLVDPQLPLALARHLKARGEKALAAEEPAAAIAKLKQAQEIFTWLLRDPQWQVLKPTEIKSQFGTTLALQSDGSILASGVNPEQETYTIAAQPGMTSITALRLETLPHSSFPKGGSGRDHNGSFFLNELTVNVSQPGDPPAQSSPPWKLQSAVASFHRSTAERIQLAIDGDQRTRWDAWPEVYRRQEAVFEMKPNPADLTAATLVIQLHSDGSGGLGRFRLAVTNEPDAVQRAATRMNLQYGEVVDLSVALAKAHGRLGRWRESANHYLQVVKLDPASHRPWGIAASALLLAGDPAGYRQHCRAMLEQFHGTKLADVADTVCKTGLLIPDAVSLSELPIQVVRAGAEDPKWSQNRTGFIVCNALISYREGKPADAIDWTKKMSSLEQHPGAMALVVRAMSEEKLGQHEHAVKSLAAAGALIPAELRTLGAADYAGPLPVPTASIYDDWLVAEILRREAESQINGIREPKSDSG